MRNVHVLSAAPARRNAARNRFAIAAIIVAAIAVLGAASIASFDEFSARALGQASANVRHTKLLDTAKPMAPSDPHASGEQQRDFDYFPDRYRNQATEPAEPIATF